MVAGAGRNGLLGVTIPYPARKALVDRIQAPTTGRSVE